MVALTALSNSVGCSTAGTAASDNESTAPTGKIAINFEGTVEAVDEAEITLENGQVLLITDDTVFSNAGGVTEDISLSKGDHIQGYTADDPTAPQITASRIHIIEY